MFQQVQGRAECAERAQEACAAGGRGGGPREPHRRAGRGVPPVGRGGEGAGGRGRRRESRAAVGLPGGGADEAADADRQAVCRSEGLGARATLAARGDREAVHASPGHRRPGAVDRGQGGLFYYYLFSLFIHT